MLAVVRLATSGLLSVNLTALVELVAFLLMLWVLARFIYPPVMAIIDERQRAIASQLAAADKAQNEAEERLRQADGEIREARSQAGQIIDRANRAAERTQQLAEEKAREEARRIVEGASRDIEAERQGAVRSIRQQMVEIVSGAVSKLAGESLDGQRKREVIESAIEQVAEEEAGVTG